MYRQTLKSVAIFPRIEPQSPTRKGWGDGIEKAEGGRDLERRAASPRRSKYATDYPY